MSNSDRASHQLPNQPAAYLAAIVRYSDDAIVSKDLKGIVKSWNPAAERLFGWPAREILGKPIGRIIPPDRLQEEELILDTIKRGQRAGSLWTVRKRKDGGLIDVSVTVSPVKNKAGVIIGASKIARDIHERKILFNELAHRLKNTMAIVQTLAAMTLRITPPDEKQAFLSRLAALAEAHDVLTEQRWRPASIAESVNSALLPFRSEPSRITLSGDDFMLQPDAAIRLVLLIHELGTNALKYGALSVPTGKIRLRWSTGDGFLLLGWRETGVPNVKHPQRKGFGFRMLEQIIPAEGGHTELVFGDDGLSCEIRIRLNED